MSGSVANSRERLEALGTALRGCRICVERPLGPKLPHAPNPIFRVSTTARLCIASQAAGTLANASSVPFNDASGERLRSWLGVTREEFYDASRVAIVPMGFCFPGQDAKGGDLPPRRECAPQWRSRLFAAMPRIELVLAIGQYAQAWHLGPARKANLTDTVSVRLPFRSGPRCQAWAYWPIARTSSICGIAAKSRLRHSGAHSRRGGRSPPFASWPGKQKPIGTMATRLAS